MTARSGPPQPKSTPLTYREAGVDIDAGNALVRAISPLAKATKRAGVLGGLGGFGALFDPKAAGLKDPILVATTDGAGTKVKIAAETGHHDTIGIDLVAMCVNDLVVQAAEPLFFLDYFACGKLDTGVAERVIAGIADGCRQAGAALVGGETAEMPVVYAPGDYDLAGFAVGAAERGALLPRGDIGTGDVVLGLTSSGAHSNGFSLIHRIVRDHKLDWKKPAPFDARRSLGEALLTPTRIYVKPLLAAIRDTGAIKALAHITGGGLIENVPRVLPDKLAAHIDLAAWTPQPVFAWLSQAGNIEEPELLRTFNCGIGMVIVAAADGEGQLRKLLERNGETVVRLGVVEQRKGEAGVVTQGRLELAR